MDFQTPYSRIKSPAEPGGGGTRTSQAYVPATVQIMAMIEAGKRLDAFRAAKFDFDGPEEAELEPVPLRAPGVDLVDVSDQVRELERRLAEARAASAVKPAPDPAPAAGVAGAAAPAAVASAPAK